MWTKEEQPYQLPESVTPQFNWENQSQIPHFNVSLPDLLSDAFQHHPNLKVYNYKLDALTIDKKLKFQDLLPKIDFRYNFLAKGYEFLPTVFTNPLFQNNYQYGLKIEIPTFLSQGRSSYKTAKLKIEETKLDQSQKRLSIE